MQAPISRIFVVVVLYGLSPEQSLALSSLRDVLKSNPKFDGLFVGIVYDNSPQPHTVPLNLSEWLYIYDGTNPGLARPYQVALERAQKEHVDWLLVLDQDTQVTAEYLEEALLVVEGVTKESKVVAIVPRLLQKGIVLSPHWPKWHRKEPMNYTPGIQEDEVWVYNSGSIFQVEALAAIGGVPQDFPLDYLDHAIYSQLRKRGGRIYQLAAGLQHELDSFHSNPLTDFASSTRLRSTLTAESRFYRKHGTTGEVLLLGLSRLRMAARMLLAGRPVPASQLLKLTVAEQFRWCHKNKRPKPI